MTDLFLYEEIENYIKYGKLSIDLPEIIRTGLSQRIELRKYQEDAIKNFIFYYTNENLSKNQQIHNLFHMATGSGKTVIMASLILYLYSQGYRKFLFFVNQTNILEKTKDNFTNNLSSKYLFNDEIRYLGNEVKIKRVDNFSTCTGLDEDIEIAFTTTQKLHSDLFSPKENALTYDDFENNKVVFISDESHHINSMTKKETKIEAESRKSWEYSVTKALSSNKDSMMLEFTATADLKDKNVTEKYKDKIVYDYPLIKFRQSGYTKDFKNFGTDSSLWERTLIALVMSEYRQYLFADLNINIKPVVMLKSQKIKESASFYELFFEKLHQLNTDDLENLYLYDTQELNIALNYFKQKENGLLLLVSSLQSSFSKEKSIIMNGASDDNKANQLLINSLEDQDNPIRFIFAVDMLNEGWDVLNLFDIVRLYDTRQTGSGKVGAYTIKEAQLIGRGARYCPFKANEEQNRFIRKYDNDLENKYRILETMFFHSKNDSKYISELRQALIETGLQDKEPIMREYQLKPDFKESDFYKTGYVFSNKRVPKSITDINQIEGKIKNKKHRYTVSSHSSSVTVLVGNEPSSGHYDSLEIKNLVFKDIPYNILLGASEKFNELKFDVLKLKYPKLTSIREFLTSDNYLGSNEIEISYHNEIKGIDLYNALVKAFASIASHIISIKPEYEGAKEFIATALSSVLKDKKIYLAKIDTNGGRGDSQNFCINSEYRLDLGKEDWYVFNDNFGTSEEKLFIKYFKTHIEPKLKEKDLEFYVVRNERISEFAIYSFDDGERFEPDFLLFIRRKGIDKHFNSQVYIEPKGSHLLKEDSWKEAFMSSIEDEHTIRTSLADEFKIIGMPFFNEEKRKEEFGQAMDLFISKI